MRLKFWGSWLLAIACLAVCLTMGCEKGALGVKPAIVKGKIVRADTGVGIDGVTVRLISKEAKSDANLEQGANFAITTTKNGGKFAFFEVRPDNIVIEYVYGTNSAVYPSDDSSGSSSEESGDTEKSDVEAIYVHSGDVKDLGNLPLSLKKDSIIVDNFVLRLNLINSVTKEDIDGDKNFSVDINDESYSLTADALRNSGIKLKSASKLTIKVNSIEKPPLYKEQIKEMTSVSKNMFVPLELDPVSYNFVITPTHVPPYIKPSMAIINVIAETQRGGEPWREISRQKIHFNKDSADALPTVFQVPEISMPVHLRIQVYGYEDEIVEFDAATLQPGTQGNYILDIDFINSDGTAPEGNGKREFVYTNTDDTAYLADNVIKRDVVLRVVGDDLLDKSEIKAKLNHLPYSKEVYKPQTITNVNNERVGKVIAGQETKVTFEGVPVGYETDYMITVTPTVPPGLASGPFAINSSKPVKIPLPEQKVMTAFEIPTPIKAKRSGE